MRCERPFRILFILTMAMLLASPAAGVVLKTITLDGVPATQCDEHWMEEQVDLWFTATTDEDCTVGSCFFGVEPAYVWLYPCRLMGDFVESYVVYQIEIDIVDYCGVGCTVAYAYNGGTQVANAANTVVSGAETLVLNVGGGQADSFAVSSCEGQVLEIRITSEVVPEESETWSSVKSMFR
jgi:hypothetical protein